MSKSIVLTLTLCAGLVAAAAAPASAQTAHPQCGDTITQDTTLYADLVDCPGDGLVIGANGVTLDLGGHVVDGAGANDSAGVSGSGFHGARIENGTVRQFGVGIALATRTHRGTGASGNVLRRLEIVDNDRTASGCPGAPPTCSSTAVSPATAAPASRWTTRRAATGSSRT